MDLDDNSSGRTFAFPYQFPATASHREIPSGRGLARDNAIRVGCTFTPFLPFVDRCHLISDSRRGILSDVDSIARCSACGAYINAYCEASTLRWICSLCHEKNLFKKAQRRYRSSTNLPELVSPCVDFSLPDPLISDKPLVHVFLLQEFMRSDALSAVVEALNKALKLMHDDVHVLLMTYSGSRIGVYNCKSLLESKGGELLTGATVSHVNLGSSDCSRSLDVELSTLCDFSSAIEPLGSCRELLTATLPSLLDQYDSDDYCAPTGSTGQELQTAIEALADWLTGPKPAECSTLKRSSIFSVLSGEEKLSDEGCAADRCVGVVLHLFLSSPLVPASNGNFKDEPDDWLFAVAKRMCLHGVSANIWGVVGDIEQQADLGDLLSLAASTGGRLQRFVLGDYAADERARLDECLRRALTRQIAAKCLLKLRAPDLFDLRGDVEGAGHGNFLCDDELPGIMRMAVCYGDSTLAFPLTYSDREVQSSGKAFIVVQLAFSYETLVEDGDSECTGDGFDDHGNDHSYLLHVARIFDAEQDFHRLLSGEGHGDKNYSSMAGDREIYYTDNICCYDRRRRLRSARRFRLLNLRVPLTSKLYRVVTMQDAQTSALLLARQIFSRPIVVGGSELISTEVSLVISQAVAMVIAIIVAHREMVGERANALPVADAIEQLSNSGALRLLFGIVGRITQHRCGSRCDRDGAADFLSLLYNADASNASLLLYGKLFTVRSAPFSDSVNGPHALIVDPSRPLILRQSTLVLNHATAYFIDNGTELVLYRALPSIDTTLSSLQPVVNQKYLLLNYCRNRINTSPIVPSVVSVEAGTPSAVLFSKCLIEDESKYAITMQKFVEILERRVVAHFS